MIPLATTNKLAELAALAESLAKDPALEMALRKRLERIAKDATELVDDAWEDE